jgi:hypothetical protein
VCLGIVFSAELGEGVFVCLLFFFFLNRALLWKSNKENSPAVFVARLP